MGWKAIHLKLPVAKNPWHQGRLRSRSALKSDLSLLREGTSRNDAARNDLTSEDTAIKRGALMTHKGKRIHSSVFKS